MVVAINDRQWAGLVRSLGLGDGVARLEDLLGLVFAHDDGARFTHREALFAMIAREITGRDHADLGAAFDANGVVHTRYLTMVEAAQDPRLVTENPMFAELASNPSGFAYPAAGTFATLPASERLPPRPAPRIGEHSEQVLAERLGLASGEIGRLIDAGIVGIA